MAIGASLSLPIIICFFHYLPSCFFDQASDLHFRIIDVSRLLHALGPSDHVSWFVKAELFIIPDHTIRFSRAGSCWSPFGDRCSDGSKSCFNTLLLLSSRDTLLPCSLL